MKRIYHDKHASNEESSNASIEPEVVEGVPEKNACVIRRYLLRHFIICFPLRRKMYFLYAIWLSLRSSKRRFESVFIWNANINNIISKKDYQRDVVAVGVGEVGIQVDAEWGTSGFHFASHRLHQVNDLLLQGSVSPLKLYGLSWLFKVFSFVTLYFS